MLPALKIRMLYSILLRFVYACRSSSLDLSRFSVRARLQPSAATFNASSTVDLLLVSLTVLNAGILHLVHTDTAVV